MIARKATKWAGNPVPWSAAIFLAMGLIVSISFAEEESTRYMGAQKCKDCHEAKTKGGQYYIWAKTSHAAAFEVLDSNTAERVAEARGIEDPKDSAKCHKCHVTAFGVPEREMDRDFDNRNVQCEACHGPGGLHFDARLEAASREKAGDNVFGIEEDDSERVKLPRGELPKIAEETCTACHNPESPFFKEFNFEESKKEIAHPDPRPFQE